MRTFLRPRDLKTQLEQAAEALPPGHFIRKPQNQHLKETWCAVHFGLGYERHVCSCTLWVNPQQSSDTDFVLKTQDGEFLFQTTLSDVPGRRMTDDHKPGPDGRFPVQPYEPGRGTIDGPGWIAEAVRRKVAANYSASRELNLLVYANFPTDGLDYGLICTSVLEGSSNFASIWVVTNHQICSVTSFPSLGAIPELRLIYESREQFAL